MGTDRRKGIARRPKKRHSVAYYQQKQGETPQKKARLSEQVSVRSRSTSSTREVSASTSDSQIDPKPFSSPLTTITNATPLSASEKKLQYMLKTMSCGGEDIDNRPSEDCVRLGEEKEDTKFQLKTQQDERMHGYRLVDMKLMSEGISQQLACRFCQGDIQMEEVIRVGLHSEFNFSCKLKTISVEKRKQLFNPPTPQ